ncbi:MAG: chromosomal replication initiator DnaA [Hyphomicrobiaceae bacterium]|nr:chromosomal replication initiator DnaA [Hyphomicrobiaceae bacterium]
MPEHPVTSTHSHTRPSPLPWTKARSIAFPNCIALAPALLDPLLPIIENAVSRVFAVKVDDLQAPTRGRADVAFARQVAMYLAHVGGGLTLTEVGRLFRRDRTTVAHACMIVEDRRDDAGLDASLEFLECVVRAAVRARTGTDQTTRIAHA